MMGILRGERPTLTVGRQRGVAGGVHVPPPSLVTPISDGE
jgi:hypothetical protein